MDSNEITSLVKLIQSVNPESMLEIGPHEGATSKIILDNVPSIQSYTGLQIAEKGAMNKWQTDEVPDEPGKYALSDPRFQLLLRPHGSFDVTAQDLPQVDVVFIDGDHSLFGVMHDTVLAKQLAKKLIIWHDYNDIVEVKPVIEFLRKHMDILQIPTTWIVYHKI